MIFNCLSPDYKEANATERPEVSDTVSDGEITYGYAPFLSCFIHDGSKNQQQTSLHQQPRSQLPDHVLVISSQAVKATETRWQGQEIKVSGLIFSINSIFLEFA